jgi:hypothetical protein
LAAPKKPKGAKSDKLWRDAISLAVHRVCAGDESGRKNLAVLAEKLVNKAMEGDVSALKEIGDRMDGKPTQMTEVSGVGGDAIQMDSKIQIIHVKP